MYSRTETTCLGTIEIQSRGIAEPPRFCGGLHLVRAYASAPSVGGGKPPYILAISMCFCRIVTCKRVMLRVSALCGRKLRCHSPRKEQLVKLNSCRRVPGGIGWPEFALARQVSGYLTGRRGRVKLVERVESDS